MGGWGGPGYASSGSVCVPNSVAEQQLYRTWGCRQGGGWRMGAQVGRGQVVCVGTAAPSAPAHSRSWSARCPGCLQRQQPAGRATEVARRACTLQGNCRQDDSSMCARKQGCPMTAIQPTDPLLTVLCSHQCLNLVDGTKALTHGALCSCCSGRRRGWWAGGGSGKFAAAAAAGLRFTVFRRLFAAFLPPLS